MKFVVSGSSQVAGTIIQKFIEENYPHCVHFHGTHIDDIRHFLWELELGPNSWEFDYDRCQWSLNPIAKWVSDFSNENVHFREENDALLFKMKHI